MTKYCCSCKQEKDVLLFYKNRSTKDGFHVACKSCNDTYQKERYRTDSEFRERAKRKWREWNMKKKYGLTPQDYDLKLKYQRGACAICKTPVVEFEHRLCVDHNHVTGKIRGLLCDNCNMIVGVVENKDLRLKAEDYLSVYW